MNVNPKLENNGEQFLPKPYTKKRFYTLADVRRHCNSNDCWVTLFQQVFDLTRLI